VGCGRVGCTRAGALGAARLVACADRDRGRATALAAPRAAYVSDDWREVVRRDDVDIVIVATLNDSLAEISAAALGHGKHVLVEKPGARSVAEIDAVIEAQRRSGRHVHVGFNHRYHPAMRKAKELSDSGVVGDMMFVRGRYGHGGRPGYEREWRADPALSGGGELIDQGVHVIDLSRWFLGEFPKVHGTVETYFWQMPVDDNALIWLQTAQRQTAFLHVSCTEWKNLFSFEIYGTRAKLHAEGLGGSYGLERLSFHRMLPQMGPPETTMWEYPRGDESWAVEFAEFLDDVRRGRTPAVNLGDARAALVIVEAIYQESRRAHHA